MSFNKNDKFKDKLDELSDKKQPLSCENYTIMFGEMAKELEYKKMEEFISYHKLKTLNVVIFVGVKELWDILDDCICPLAYLECNLN